VDVLYDRIGSTSSNATVCQILRAANHNIQLFVVTPNVQHAVLLTKSQAFREAYSQAHMILPDGWPIAVIASIIHRRYIRRVIGSDILPEILQRMNDGVVQAKTVIIVGGDTNSVQKLRLMFPAVVLKHEPCPPAELTTWERRENLVRRIASVGEQGVIVLALGAPKQELLGLELTECGARAPIICCGAAVDFLVGAQKRAPRPLRVLGLEWLFRAITNPRRLGQRYARDVLPFMSHAVRAIIRS